MSKKKILIVIAVALLAAVLSAPYWGGCALVNKGCQTWCAVRYFDSAVSEASCKLECAAEKVQCDMKRR